MDPNRPLPDLFIRRNSFATRQASTAPATVGLMEPGDDNPRAVHLPDPLRRASRTSDLGSPSPPFLPGPSQRERAHAAERALQRLTSGRDELMLDTKVGPNLAIDVVRHVTSNVESMERIKNGFVNATSRKRRVRDGVAGLGVAAWSGVDLDQFVHILKAQLPRPLRNDVDMITNLCELFQQVDVNGDAEVSWEEFTTFVVEAGMADRNHHQVVESIKEYHPRPPPPGLAGGPTQMERVMYFPGLDKVGLVERDSRVVRIHGADTGTLHKVLRAHKGAVTAADYIAPHGMVATCAMDSTIAFWDSRNLFQLRRHAALACGTQSAVAWDPGTSMLFTGSMRGSLHAFDPGFEEMVAADYVTSTPLSPSLSTAPREGHDESVTCLCPIPRLASLASASIDTTVRLWDPATGVRRRTLRGHKKGVLSIDYLDEYRVLASAGFEHEVLIWNPFVESPISRLMGHCSPLTNVVAVPGTPQLITADSGRRVKVWDVRNWKCVQTLGLGPGEGDDDTDRFPLTSMAYNTRSSTIVTCNRRLHFYSYGDGETVKTAEDGPVVAVLYNESTMSVITVCGGGMKVWDGKTGSLQRAFPDITQHDITAVALDPKHRKIVVADSSGQVQVRHASNGVLLATLRKHAKEATCVAYCASRCAIASASAAGGIVVHDDTPTKQGLWGAAPGGREDIELQPEGRGDDVSCLVYSDDYNLLLTGGRGALAVWSFDNSQPLAMLEDHEGEVTAAVFLGTFPLVVSADSGGWLRVWPVGPVAHEWRNKELVSWQNSEASIQSLAFCTEENTLYVGDDDGMVRAWALYSLLEDSSPWLETQDHRAMAAAGETWLRTGSRSPAVTRDMPVHMVMQERRGENARIRRASNYSLEDGEFHPHDHQKARLRRKSPDGEDPGHKRGADPPPLFYLSDDELGNFWGIGDDYTPEPPPLNAEWKAHSDTVGSICVVEDADVVITGGFDTAVRLWGKHRGEKRGELESRPFAPPTMWNFPENKVSRMRESAKAKAKQIVSEARAQERAAFQRSRPFTRSVRTTPLGKTREVELRMPPPARASGGISVAHRGLGAGLSHSNSTITNLTRNVTLSKHLTRLDSTERKSVVREGVLDMAGVDAGWVSKGMGLRGQLSGVLGGAKARRGRTPDLWEQGGIAEEASMDRGDPSWRRRPHSVALGESSPIDDVP